MDNRDSTVARIRGWNWAKLPVGQLKKHTLVFLGGLTWVVIQSQNTFGQLTPFPPSVEQVRSILNQVANTPEERDARLKKAIEGLQTTRERREAFLLGDWRDQQTDLPVSSVDRKYRQELSTVILREYKAVLQSQDKDKIRLLFEKLPEFARQGEDSPTVASLIKDLSSEIIPFAKQGPVEIRRIAMITLAKIQADSDLMVPLFAQLIRDNQPEIRFAAAEGVDTLLKLQVSGNYAKGSNQPIHLRREAISVQTAKLIPMAMQSLKDSQSQIRILSSDSLLSTAMLFSSLISDPNQTLAGVEPAEIRRMIQVEWTELEPLLMAWVKALPGLGAGLVDRNPMVRLNCQRTLDELAAIRNKRQKQNEALGVNLPDPLANPIRSMVPTLVEALRDPDTRVRRAAIDVLEGVGSLAINAAPMLQASLDDPDSFVRWASIRALAAMGSETLRQSKEKIQGLTKDPDADVRKAAESSLKRMAN